MKLSAYDIKPEILKYGIYCRIIESRGVGICHRDGVCRVPGFLSGQVCSLANLFYTIADGLLIVDLDTNRPVTVLQFSRYQHIDVSIMANHVHDDMRDPRLDTPHEINTPAIS